MKDQNSLEHSPTPFERWDLAKGILLESLHKPDNHLRSCAYNQECFEDVIQIRDQLIEYVEGMTNPRPLIDPSEYIDLIPSRY